MMRLHLRRAGSRRGQTLVEFALVIPIVMLLMIGVFDLGNVVFTNNSLSDGARHAARAAIINPRDAGVSGAEPTYCERIEDSMRTAIRGLPLTSMTVTYQVISPPDALSSQHVLCTLAGPTGATLPLSAGPGDRVVVDIGADVNLITPLVSRATGRDGFALEAESTMQVTFVPTP